MPKDYDVIVIGAGPSGLMAALAASAGGARVLVLERMASPLRKLLATGGGRCNLTRRDDSEAVAKAFGKQWRFMLAALEKMSPDDIRAFFHSHGVPTKVLEGDCVFPVTERARDVCNALLEAAKRNGVEIRCGVSVPRLVFSEDHVSGVEADGDEIFAGKVIVACGGKGYPELGSDGLGYGLARQAGHSITDPSPAMVPLVAGESWVRDLAGLALPVELRIALPKYRKKTFRDILLFTHRGISGPVVQDHSGLIGDLLNDGAVPVRVSLIPGVSSDDWEKEFERWRISEGKKQVRLLLGKKLQKRLVDKLLFLGGLDSDMKVSELPKAGRRKLIECLCDLPLTITATEGWGKAMVTRGGVKLSEVSPLTLESKLVAGLYFAGEVLDLDGPCGGYNLTWAFASGNLAGSSASG